MQLKVKINLKKPLTLPVHYNAILQGIIYNASDSINHSYTKKIHDEGKSKNGVNKFKYFCFSKIKGKYIFENHKITFLESLYFEIRSADAYFLHLVYEGFQKNGISFYNNNFKPILKLEDCIIQTKEIYIKMLSPIVALKPALNNKKDYLTPYDTEFIPYLLQNYQNKYYDFYQNTAPQLDIEVLDVSYRDKLVTTFNGTYLTAWYGIYALKSTPEALTFLYNCGLGSKNAQGFGLFTVLKKENED